MKLSDKVLNLLKSSGKPFEKLPFPDDYLSCSFESPIGEVTLYTLDVYTFNLYGGTDEIGNWFMDIYSLEECTDEELLFMKLQEPHKDWKTHSEVLNVIEELVG
jgi:hypothetical protein